MQYAPLYLLTVRFSSSRKRLDAERINEKYQVYRDISRIPDRLRWCRHHLGLMQKEVAVQLGIARSTYASIEAGTFDFYDKNIVDKLAALYQIPVEDLLDDYNRFLYYGQGRAIKQYRQHLGMNKQELAAFLHLDPSIVYVWEAEKKRVSKRSWKKYFQDKIVIARAAPV